MAFPGMIAIDFPHISAHFQGSTKMISICLGVASNSSHNSGVPRIAGDINVHEIHHKDMFKYDSSMSSNFKTYISIIWENYKISRQISYHILQKVAYYTVERRRVTAKSAPSAAWRQIFFPGGCHIFGQNMLQNVKKSHMVGKKVIPGEGIGLQIFEASWELASKLSTSAMPVWLCMTSGGPVCLLGVPNNRSCHPCDLPMTYLTYLFHSSPGKKRHPTSFCTDLHVCY